VLNKLLREQVYGLIIGHKVMAHTVRINDKFP
jgi:hypothetical protein